MDASALMTPREAAAFLRLSTGTLENMRTQGRGPAFIRLGDGKRAAVRYRRVDLEAWLRRVSAENVTP